MREIIEIVDMPTLHKADLKEQLLAIIIRRDGGELPDIVEEMAEMVMEMVKGDRGNGDAGAGI